MFYNREINSILEELDTSKSGLSSKEANARLKKYGYNILPKRNKITLIKVILEQFNSPINYILFITALISIFIGEKVDAIFIFLVIILDAIVGTIQEWKAEKSSSSLQDMITVKAKVIRDFNNIEIDSKDVVLGDIVIIEPGNKIPADIRLISSNNLSIDESFLTGESNAANKNSDILDSNTKVIDQINICFAGSTVMRGRGIGVVVKTGINTEIGKIANEVILKETTKTPLTVRMEKLVKQIGFLVIGLALILTFVLYLKNEAPKEIFLYVVALSVSAIPEGLSVVITVALSIATNKMAKKNVIVRKLNAVEGLGSCTVIACDKTGTLTLNEQTARLIELPDGSIYKVTGEGYNDNGDIIENNVKSKYKTRDEIKNIANLIYINNESTLLKKDDIWEKYGDEIDLAMKALYYKINGYSKPNIEIISSIPYESENKFSALFYKNKDIFVTLKGSPEIILDYCTKMNIDGKEKNIDKEYILNRNNGLAKQGYRVIAIANGICNDFKEKDNYDQNDIKDLTLLGLIAFIDPIRKEANESLKRCYEAGINVVMITGDHPLTAGSIAKELKMIKSFDEVRYGDELENYMNSDSETFDNYVKNSKVFARVTPNEKLAIVESFKRQGEFVAVTGDGVNDAPAMKSANISIAMGSGTDVAKETGSILITDDNFMSIVSGIEEGRHAYNNIRKVVYFLISCGFAEVLFVILAIIFNLPAPLVAIQLLWLNLVTDGIQDVALAFEKVDDNVMLQKPRNPNESIFDKFLIKQIMTAGIVIGIIVFVTWIIMLNHFGNTENSLIQARSYVMILMVFLQNIHAFNCRSESKSIFKIPIKNNYFLLISIVCVIILQIVVSELSFTANILGIAPIKFRYIILCLLGTIPLVLSMEIFKKIMNKKSKN